MVFENVILAETKDVGCLSSENHSYQNLEPPSK